MSTLLLSTTVAALLPAVVFMTAWFLSMRTESDREKLAPFECGFDPKNMARIPFSLRFFLLAIIFVVFDIEIVLLTPIPLMTTLIKTPTFFTGVAAFLMILLLGLLYEWTEGSLEWSS